MPQTPLHVAWSQWCSNRWESNSFLSRGLRFRMEIAKTTSWKYRADPKDGNPTKLCDTLGQAQAYCRSVALSQNYQTDQYRRRKQALSPWRGL